MSTSTTSTSTRPVGVLAGGLFLIQLYGLMALSVLLTAAIVFGLVALALWLIGAVL